MFNKVLFKNSTSWSTERFSKPLLQSNLDIVFLMFSIIAFSNTRPFAHMLDWEVHVC